MIDAFNRILTRYTTERSPSDNTLRQIRGIIPRFLKFCEGRGRATLDDITDQDVIDWLFSLNGGHRTSSKKVYKQLVCIILNYAARIGERSRPLPEIRYKGPTDVPRAPQKDFSRSEIRLMKEHQRESGLKERLIFNLIARRPLRISELANLQVGDLDFQTGQFTVTRTKNHTTRVLPLPGKPKAFIQDLQNLVRGKNPDDLVFGITPRRMAMLVHNIFKQAGIDPRGRSAHAFRHTVIMTALHDKQMPPSIVAQMAGNTPSVIYERYISQVSAEQMESAGRALD